MSSALFTGLTLTLILLTLSHQVTSQDNVLLRANNAIISVGRDENLKCKKDLIECLDDCHSSRICRNESIGLVQIISVKCVEDSDTPYCDPSNGMCTNLPGPGCAKQDFICPSVDGAYPDPNNCSRYHLCGSGVAITNECPPNNVYDSSTGTCKFRYRAADCVTINCASKDGQVVVYPADDSIWGRCINGKALIIDRCKPYERYNTNSQKCELVCRQEGNLPLENECRKYVLCARGRGTQYSPYVQQCACNEGFDPEKLVCSKTAECISKITSPCGGNSGTTTTKPAQSRRRRSLDLLARIINNSGNHNTGNEVSNGDDDVDGNLVNGNDNGHNVNSGNVAKARLAIAALIINNAGSGNRNNSIANGDDDVNGNLVNGNSNGNNINSGNVQESKPKHNISPLIINNSGSANSNNEVSNGDDNVDGNLVNGNDNGHNVNSGNVAKEKPAIGPLIINNAGSGNRNNSIANGDDDVNGNLVNGNSNGNNINSGNVQGSKPGNAVAPLIINNSGSANSNNNVVNGNDSVDGNLVNGNDNGDNKHSGNVIVSSDEGESEEETEQQDEIGRQEMKQRNLAALGNFIESILQWLVNIFRRPTA